MGREQKIIRASWWAIAGNGILAVLKLTVGFISGSFALIADGIDSTTDIVSSLVVLLAARIIAKPPNINNNPMVDVIFGASDFKKTTPPNKAKITSLD